MNTQLARFHNAHETIQRHCDSFVYLRWFFGWFIQFNPVNEMLVMIENCSKNPNFNIKYDEGLSVSRKVDNWFFFLYRFLLYLLPHLFMNLICAIFRVSHSLSDVIPSFEWVVSAFHWPSRNISLRKCFFPLRWFATQNFFKHYFLVNLWLIWIYHIAEVLTFNQMVNAKITHTHTSHSVTEE